MSSSSLVPAFLIGLLSMSWGSHSLMLSSRLIHRFSEEVREIRVSRAGVMGGSWWPSKGSMEYCRELVGSDLLRRKRKNRELEAVAAKFDLLYPSRGSDTMSLGNDFGCDGAGDDRDHRRRGSKRRGVGHHVLKLTASCIAYVVGGGPITACCNGIKAVAANTKTLADRRTVCSCLKTASNIPRGSPATLAKQCGVKVPFGVTPSPTTNCNTIP